MLRPPSIWSRISTFLGLPSLHAAGSDAYIIIALRSLRMFAGGIPSLILALFFSSLGFPDSRIGLFMSLTLLGDVVLSLFFTLVADSIGRRNVLLVGSVLMVVSGTAFALSENFWVLLLAAVLGVVSVTGGDCGPFRAVEESILSGLAGESERGMVLSWYITATTFAGAVGTEVAGRVVKAVEGLVGNEIGAFHVLFWGYAGFGAVGCVLCLGLTRKCEVGEEKGSRKSGRSGNRVSSTTTGEGDMEEEEVLLQAMTPSTTDSFDDQQPSHRHPTPSTGKPKNRSKSYFTQISRSSLTTLIPLWALLMLDSLADGMTPYTLMNYYISLKFSLSKSTLGDITSLSQFLCAFSAIFAGPLSKRIGLINTMVFTHLPSSLASAFIPLPKTVAPTIALLLFRAALNSMDQAPRTAFIAAVVKPQERTSVMGITSTLRILALSVGPSVTGLLAGNERFWAAFVATGVCRVVYDLGLWVMFVNVKVGDGAEEDERVGGHGNDGGYEGDEAREELLGRDSEEEGLRRESKDEEGGVKGV